MRKLYIQARDLGEEENEVSEQLRSQGKHLRQLAATEQARLDDLELDIAHAKFMIDPLE